MRSFIQICKLDACRYIGIDHLSIISILKLYIKTPGFKYMVRMRFMNYCRHSSFGMFLLPVAYLMYRHSMIKYGIVIPYNTSIGEGFYIGHFGGVVVNSNVVIGKNVNISHGVTIGQGGDDNDKGSPIIGDNVYIGPNSTIVGKIRIGNGVAIGANAFVNKDVPDNVTVGGVPAKIISLKGSLNYIHNKI